MSVKTPVYLDHHATTPLDPRVREVLERVQRDHFGNPASSWHAPGWAAAKLVEVAREQVAALLGATPAEIVFTSGATEAANLAILGSAAVWKGTRPHLVVSDLEHEAVAAPVAELEGRGWRVTRVGSGPAGIVAESDVAAVLDDQTALVAVMAAQNEIGTLQPLGAIGRACRRKGVLFFTDAAQAAGKVPVDVEEDKIDLLALSAHKLYGPKGVGALFVRRRDPRVRLEPLQYGGGQERGLRPGTLNVPGIAALGEACRIARAEMGAEGRRLTGLRIRLLEGLRRDLTGVHLNGDEKRRLPGNLNVSFSGVRAHGLLGRLTLLAVSSSSACTSAATAPSPILTGLGVGDDLARASLRIGLGRGTTVEEVDFARATIVDAVTHLRKEGGTD